ncbi:mitochondrial dicarboxylate carrier-like isoform X2 [Dysidea avara]|uniref:mitochondrial dicarboxylate carrier-like isoform X2 n=1 Tax=Dysidea avara TaxID=196820 RepID=UPI003326C001
MATRNKKQVAQRWYLGGIASAGAACGTHPLDLLKVHLQTQQVAKKGFIQMIAHVLRNDGFFALYSGLTASILRQITYSGVRYGVYELLKGRMLKSSEGQPISLSVKLCMGAFAGACGGLVGCPPDLVNVRMQADIKLPMELRRNYRHGLDGIWRVAREEGVMVLWTGGSAVVMRSIMMTIAQIVVYEQVKQFFLYKWDFEDNIPTHFLSSFVAGVAATILTQPVDVLKTRMMDAKSGQYKNILDCVWYTAKAGPLGFYKGFVPACIRLTPHTILTWLLLEQLRRLFPPPST